MRRGSVFPLIVLVVIAYAIFHRHDHSRDPDEDRDHDRVARAEARTAKSSYALDVQKVTWPPLVEGSNAAPPTAAALATANYYVVLDGSGSMKSKDCGGGTSRIEAAVDAMKQFFATAPADANIGLAAFDRHTISERVPLGVGNRDALNAALEKVDAGSDTPLLSAMRIGYEKLTAQARLQLGYGEYHLVVVTDGKPDPRSEDPSPIVKRILSESPIVLHTVGFCIDSDHVLNQPNRMYYASATNPEQLQKSLQAVLAEAPAFDAKTFH